MPNPKDSGSGVKEEALGVEALGVEDLEVEDLEVEDLEGAVKEAVRVEDSVEVSMEVSVANEEVCGEDKVDSAVVDVK